MSTLSALKITARLSAKLTKSVSDGSSPVHDFQAAIFSGAPTDANLLYNDRLTISNCGATDLDLAGSLENQIGETLTFAKVYGIYVHNRSSTASDKVHIGGDANSVPIFGAVADYLIIGPGGCLLAIDPTDGWTVTASTGDIIEISNPGGNDIDCDVAILGKSS